MPPASQSVLFSSDDDVVSLLSQLGLDARLDDQDAGGQAAFLSRAHNWATGRILFYCAPFYDASAMASSWLVNEWASVLATFWVCVRRVNPLPDVIRQLVYGGDGLGEGVMGDLKDVREGRAQIPDVGARNVPWPAYSNVRVDPRFRVRQVRVIRQTSEGTPTRYPQPTDLFAENSVEPF